MCNYQYFYIYLLDEYINLKQVNKQPDARYFGSFISKSNSLLNCIIA
ncbi:MAG: hypothetical protein WAS72_08405 [Saprospiraceae bacterium]